MNREFFIPCNVPSSKNGRISNSVPSKSTLMYMAMTKKYWIRHKDEFREALLGICRPYYIEFTFIKKTEVLYDYINAAQIVQDMMVKYGWIDEDNVYAIKPYFGDPIKNKDNPGLIIKILKNKPQHDLQTH